MYCPSFSRAITLVAVALSLSACGGGDETRLRIDNLSQDVAAQSARITSLEREVADLTTERDELAAEVERLKQPPGPIQNAAVDSPGATEPSAPAVRTEAQKESASPAREDTDPITTRAASSQEQGSPAAPAAAPAQPQFAIHLASYRRLDQVRAAWPKLLEKYPQLLGDLQPHVTKLELEGLGGTYYRLKAGPFGSRDAASQRCQSFKAMDEYCVVSAFDGMSLDESS